MILHIIQNPKKLAQALPLLATGDQLVFIDDGVYATVNGTEEGKTLVDSGIASHALDTALQLRGLPLGHTVSQVVTMAEFVRLVMQADKTLSWY